MLLYSLLTEFHQHGFVPSGGLRSKLPNLLCVLLYCWCQQHYVELHIYWNVLCHNTKSSWIILLGLTICLVWSCDTIYFFIFASRTNVNIICHEQGCFSTISTAVGKITSNIQTSFQGPTLLKDDHSLLPVISSSSYTHQVSQSTFTLPWFTCSPAPAYLLNISSVFLPV